MTKRQEPLWWNSAREMYQREKRISVIARIFKKSYYTVRMVVKPDLLRAHNEKMRKAMQLRPTKVLKKMTDLERGIYRARRKDLRDAQITSEKTNVHIDVILKGRKVPIRHASNVREYYSR